MPRNALRSSRPILRVTLAAAILAMPCQGIAADPQVQVPQPPQRFIAPDPVALDDAIEQRLAELRSKASAWDWIDLVERGRIAVAEGDFAGASIAFEASLQCADEPIERLVSLQLLGRALLHDAQTMPVPGDQERDARSATLRRAGDCLNEAQIFSPLSRDIAAARVTAWSQSGDQLETLAAEHQLRVIDPAMEGTARMDPITAAIVCYAVFKAGQLILKHYDFGGNLKAEHRAAMLGALDFAVSASLTGLPFAGQAADIGIGFVEDAILD